MRLKKKSRLSSCSRIPQQFYQSPRKDCQNRKRSTQLNWDILKPLLDKTVFNILNNSGLDNQTGPAIREDYEVIKKHHKMLNEQHLSVYEAITQVSSKPKKRNEL